MSQRRTRWREPLNSILGAGLAIMGGGIKRIQHKRLSHPVTFISEKQTKLKLTLHTDSSFKSPSYLHRQHHLSENQKKKNKNLMKSVSTTDCLQG